MRANEYQTRAMSTRLPSCENATYMLFGLMAEIGEIADFHAVLEEMVALRLIEMGRTANDTYVRVIED
jgi:hypothetical protein